MPGGSGDAGPRGDPRHEPTDRIRDRKKQRDLIAPTERVDLDATVAAEEANARGETFEDSPPRRSEPPTIEAQRLPGGGLQDFNDVEQTENGGAYDARMLGRKYRVTNQLGQGGSATIYEAEHIALGRPLAVKVLSAAASRQQEERLKREAMVLSRMSHPGIINVTDLDRTPDNRLYMVMERLEGVDLSTRLKSVGRFEIDDAIDLGLQLLNALSVAHAEGVVHRDVKPANLFLTEAKDGSAQLKVLDFGTARVEGATKLTVDGSLIGTPAYMTPEQIFSEEITARTDIYGAALVLYHLMTGTQPFAADSFEEVMHRVVSHVPEPPSALVGPEAEPFDNILLRGLRKRSEDRWPSAREMAQALRVARRTASSAPTESPLVKPAAPAEATAPPAAIAPTDIPSEVVEIRVHDRRTVVVVGAIAFFVGGALAAGLASLV